MRLKENPQNLNTNKIKNIIKHIPNEEIKNIFLAYLWEKEINENEKKYFLNFLKNQKNNSLLIELEKQIEKEKLKKQKHFIKTKNFENYKDKRKKIYKNDFEELKKVFEKNDIQKQQEIIENVEFFDIRETLELLKYDISNETKNSIINKTLDFHHKFLSSIFFNSNINKESKEILYQKVDFIDKDNLIKYIQTFPTIESLHTNLIKKLEKISIEDYFNILNFIKNYQTNINILLTKVKKVDNIKYLYRYLDSKNYYDVNFIKFFVNNFTKKISLKEFFGILKKYPNIDQKIGWILSEIVERKEYNDNFFKNFLEKNNITKSKENFTKEINENQAFLTEIPYVSDKRSLVLYIREGQGNFTPHSEMFAYFLKYYIENNYSKIWNNFDILLRFGDYENFGGKKIKYVEDNSFRALSSIFADSIHLTHGTPEYKIPGTNFLIGDAINLDNYKKSFLDEKRFTKVPLLYYHNTNNDIFKKAQRKQKFGFPIDKNQEKILEIFLKSIKDFENQIINQLNEKQKLKNKNESIKKEIKKLTK